jgi:hypothetical protein
MYYFQKSGQLGHHVFMGEARQAIWRQEWGMDRKLRCKRLKSLKMDSEMTSLVQINRTPYQRDCGTTQRRRRVSALSACNEMGAGKNPADDSNVFGH